MQPHSPHIDVAQVNPALSEVRMMQPSMLFRNRIDCNVDNVSVNPNIVCAIFQGECLVKVGRCGEHVAWIAPGPVKIPILSVTRDV